MATDMEAKIKDKKYRAMTALTNMQSFKDWSFAAYKVEEHEKDVVMEALEYYQQALQKELDELQEGSNDNTDICE